MKFPPHTFYKNVWQQIISSLVVVSLLGVTAAPQVAAAKEERPASFSESIAAFATELQERGTDLISFVVPATASGEEQGITFPVASEREPLKTLTMVATAYSSEVWQTDATPCITANGFDLCSYYEQYGHGNTIATNILPLGTIVHVTIGDETKEYVVRDRMNARYNGQRRLDIWMPTTTEAKQFGVKRVEVKVFPRGQGK